MPPFGAIKFWEELSNRANGTRPFQRFGTFQLYDFMMMSKAFKRWRIFGFAVGMKNFPSLFKNTDSWVRRSLYWTKNWLNSGKVNFGKSQSRYVSKVYFNFFFCSPFTHIFCRRSAIFVTFNKKLFCRWFWNSLWNTENLDIWRAVQNCYHLMEEV